MSIATVTIKVQLHDGDIEAIREGKLSFARAVELVLNHEHPIEVVAVEEDDNVVFTLNAIS